MKTDDDESLLPPLQPPPNNNNQTARLSVTRTIGCFLVLLAHESNNNNDFSMIN